MVSQKPKMQDQHRAKYFPCAPLKLLFTFALYFCLFVRG